MCQEEKKEGGLKKLSRDSRSTADFSRNNEKAKPHSHDAFKDLHSSVFNDASLIHLLADPVDHKDHVRCLRGSVLR